MVKDKLNQLYNKYYKLLLIVPALIFVISIGYLFMFYQQHGDIFEKSVSLTGGTSITVFDNHASISDLESNLKRDFPDLSIRGISDIATGSQHGFTIETKADPEEIKPVLEKYLGYTLTSENSSIEFSGATLSKGFYAQLMSAIISAFLLMAWVIFIIFSNSWKMKGIATILTFFALALALNEVGWIKGLSVLGILAGLVITISRKETKSRDKLLFAILSAAFIVLIYVYPFKLLIVLLGILLIALYIFDSIPSFAVILAAFADILMTLAVVDMRGIVISGAGIVAFLMLIGYSVDTDILLTSRLLKSKEGTINRRLYGALKTGMTMTLTAIAAVGVSLVIIYSLSETLRQIFEILLIGLFFDIINTWVTNASMLKWYMEAKKIS